MDIEFHYYMTYLIAARAGFDPADAVVVAQSAQEIDDNHIPIEVDVGTADAYRSTVSQTMDILRPHRAERIYPIFHFIPGEPDAPSAKRADGLRSEWLTTPNSPLANEMLETALRSDDLYRIGASAHAFADTWAHQNFIGKDDAMNEMPIVSGVGRLQRALDSLSFMRIGHALAGHKPDIPDLIWQDGRLAEPTIVNVDRFAAAADHLFRKLYCHKNANADRDMLDRDAASLVADLRADIGTPSLTSAPRAIRVERYKTRALTAPYGGTAIPDYEVGKWADAAFVEKRADWSTQLDIFMADHAGMAGDVLDFDARMQCTWRDTAYYRNSSWFKFQEAVCSHLDECWDVLVKRFPVLKS